MSLRKFVKTHNSMKYVLSILVGLVFLLFFQNCGQGGSIKMMEGAVLDDLGNAIFPSYSSKTVSSSQAPPLKIIFLMDNSNSMALNNLNLQQSLTSMFDNQAANLSQFDADIYFYTTAQLSGLASSFSSKTQAPASLSNVSLSEIENSRSPASFTGLIAGDLLGYETRYTETPDMKLTEYWPHPVVAFREVNNTRHILPSVRYQKGSSIAVLKNNIQERLEIISPDRASGISDASVFSALDTESALCGLARLLRTPGSTVQMGDIASFVIVSDENEADVKGLNCLANKKREYLYRATCEQRVPASVVSDTTIHYNTVPGADQQRTNFQIKTPSVTKNYRNSKITLTRPAKNAVCKGTYEAQFNVNFSAIEKSYTITYSKQPKLGVREGGVISYGDLVSGLKVSSGGVAPAGCASNIENLQSLLGDTQSKLTIQACAQNADVVKAQQTTNTYAKYPTANPGSSCPSGLLTELSLGGTRTITGCSISKGATVAINSVPGFPASGNQSSCKSLISAVCNSPSYKNCTFTSHSPQVTAASLVSPTIKDKVDLKCNASCSKFPGFCASASQTIQSYGSSIGYTSCTASNTDAGSTYTVDSQMNLSVTATVAHTCNSTCNDVPSACGNNKSSKTVAQYNQSCTASSTLIPGGASQSLALPSVVDTEKTVNCSSLCSESKGICSGTSTVAQHIEQKLNGKNCSVKRADRPVGETIKTHNVSGLKPGEIKGQYCPAGFEKKGNPILTTSYQDSQEKVSGEKDLKSYILERLENVIGRKNATISAFITPEKGANSNLSTSFGEVYKSLVETWQAGSVNDIRSPSYAPALTQLSATLKSQLTRSVTFPEVQGHQKVRQVWHLPQNHSDWQLLGPDKWSASGGTVTLDKSIDLDISDQIKIEYY